MKNVLLPIDGSVRSLRTIDMVKQICDPRQVTVTMVMVLPDQMHIDGQFERERIRRKAEQEMATFAALLEGWTVDTVLLRGNPGPEIVQFAREKGYDTLIMTRSSRGPLQKLGSVATYIVRNAQFLNLIIMREAEPE
ncbi:MAG TPA: universal stress protein [Candidatus Evtepia faecigallinarum]|nr:universal stress protein [Candidatus Evtepia faecigallinarum]